MKTLAQEIIDGKRLSRKDDLSFFETADLDALADGANEIRKNFCRNRADLCTIINGRSGKCSENCKFCAQSSFHTTACDLYDILDEETILKDCREKEAAGVHAYSIVTAGRTVKGADLDKLIHIYSTLHRECSLTLCASHGLLSEDAFIRLKKAGVTRYHANIETSRRYFKHVCTTHTYDDKIRTITLAKEAGLTVCSGGIIGMGETFADRIDMAVTLAELGISSIPINALIPVKGTPLGDQKPLTPDEIIRTAAMFRYLNPAAFIRMAAGRSYFKDGGKQLFASGVNAAITGDMLTTTGTNIKQDIKMLKENGFDVRKGDK